jgi:hypothetical protein
MKKTVLTPKDKWDRGVQDGVLIVNREGYRQKALYANLPYIIHKDFPKLVRLTRLWQVANRHDYYSVSSPKLRSLSWQCEHLYYKVYGHVCYFSDVPCNWKY